MVQAVVDAGIKNRTHIDISKFDCMEARMKRMLLGICALLLGIAPVRAEQFAQDSLDLGVADTVEMVATIIPDVTTNQLKLRLELWVFNDANTLAGAAVGFGWTSIGDALSMDSAVTTALVNAAFDLQRFVYEGNNINTTNANNRFLFAGARLFSAGLAPSPTRQKWATYDFTLSSYVGCDSITLDTFAYSSGTTFKFSRTDNKSYIPTWKQRLVIRDTACVLPSNLLVNPDTLIFSATQGGSNPTPQGFSVTSDAGPLAISLVESIPWLLRSPASGTTPVNGTVQINITGLAPGVYFDSVRVESGNALNSPQFLYVQLTVAAPAPVLSVAPAQLFFNGLIGSGNPPDQIVTITNIGGGTLDWSATSSQPWLSISPSAGTGNGAITVSVDITGLSQGTYLDTITVSDPAASNNPRKVPVSLSVGSNLPTIYVNDSNYLYLPVPISEPTVFSRSFTLQNSGVGALTFDITENSAAIQSVTPSSGAAPQLVTVSFKYVTRTLGFDEFETLIITSNEAVNSPETLIVQIHWVVTPANVLLDKDTIKFSLFDCTMGSNPLPNDNFSIVNNGGDDPMPFVVSGESDLFSLTQVSGEAPAVIFVQTNFLELPIGVYYDTITVFAGTAINNPQSIIVEYAVVDNPNPPTIDLSRNVLTLPYQEESGPRDNSGFEIRNPVGGCMPWRVHEEIDYLFPESDTGNVVDQWDFIIDPQGYLFGQYPDTIYVSAAGATNDSIAVPVQLLVWRLHGDWDYDSFLSIADVTQSVGFVLEGLVALAPQPEYLVGDGNCDNIVDIADVVDLVAYLFIDGAVLCGNPY